MASVSFLSFSIFFYLCWPGVQADTHGRPLRSDLTIEQRELIANRFTEAKQWKKVIETLEPYNNELSENARLNLAMAFGQSDEFDKEVKILQGIEESDLSKKNHELYYILGRAELRLAQTKDPLTAFQIENKAIEHLRKSIVLKKDFKPAYDQLLSYFDDKKQYYEVQILLTEMSKLFGERPEILNDLCRVFTLEKFYDQAQEACLKAIKKSRSYSENYVYYAKSLADQGNDLKASSILSKAAERFPSSERTQAEAGLYYLDQKNYPVAIRYLKKSIQLNPKMASSHAGLAQAFLRSESYGEALTHFKTACQLDGQYQQPFREALALVRQKNLGQFDQPYSQGLLSCKSIRASQR